MKNLAFGLLILMAFLFSCTSNSTQKPAEKAIGPNAELARLFEDYYENSARLFPLSATVNGDNRFNDLLPIDISQPFRDSLTAFYSRFLNEIGKFDGASLSENDRISADVFKHELQIRLDGNAFPTWQIPFTQFEGLHLQMGQMGSGDGSQPFKTVKDYDDWLARAGQFPAWADTAIANFRKGMASGWTLPRACVVKMIPQCADLGGAKADLSLFLQPVFKMPADFPAADQARLKTAFQKLTTEKLRPAYRRLADFLSKEYLPASRETSGYGAVPNGKNYYDWCIRWWTTKSGLTADQIFETGKSEVARIRGEMENVRKSVGFAGDLPAFFEFLKNDPQFRPFKTAQEVLDSFGRIHKIIQPQVNKLFRLQPKCPFEIRRTEAFRELSASAEYIQGTPDGKRPGIFYTPVPDATKFTTTSGMESLFLHEAIPGHHFQVMLQMENESLPKFRRFSWYGAYGEGWALYTESLGKELGLYTNPYQYMGALGDEIHRAIRLVVDVGLHAKGWSREDALKYELENEALAEDYAISETERYMATPGQALSYKTGSMHIRELRAKYEKQLGGKFSLAAFHDEMLRDGCLPLDVLDRKMENWARRVSQ